MRLVDKEANSITAGYVKVRENVMSDIRNYISNRNDFHTFPLDPSFCEFVRQKLPQLSELASGIRYRLENNRRFVIVDDYPLPHDEIGARNFLFLALMSCIGKPTPTDKAGKEIIWEVTPRTHLPDGYTPTITEHNQAAELHTDSSYVDVPERYVALFVIRPAKEGGLSHILDGREFLSTLSESRQGRECVNVLRSVPCPSRVPTAFTENCMEEEPELALHRIISDSPLIRYRYDTIRAGFKCEPSYASSEVQWAVDYFHHALARHGKYTFSLNSGDILLANNHEILHGRTAFKDKNRLLLRIRTAQS